MVLHRFSLVRVSRPSCGQGVEANRIVPTVVTAIGARPEQNVLGDVFEQYYCKGDIL
jgi:hypothetical protein